MNKSLRIFITLILLFLQGIVSIPASAGEWVLDRYKVFGYGEVRDIWCSPTGSGSQLAYFSFPTAGETSPQYANGAEVEIPGNPENQALASVTAYIIIDRQILTAKSINAAKLSVTPIFKWIGEDPPSSHFYIKEDAVNSTSSDITNTAQLYSEQNPYSGSLASATKIKNGLNDSQEPHIIEMHYGNRWNGFQHSELGQKILRVNSNGRTEVPGKTRSLVTQGKFNGFGSPNEATLVKVNFSATYKAEVCNVFLEAVPSGSHKFIKNDPTNKLITAWTSIGARVDGPTPPEQPLPWPLSPFKGTIDVISNVNEWLGEVNNTITQRWWDGIEPGAGQAFNGFLEGRVNLNMTAVTSQGTSLFNPQHYQWDVTGLTENGTYVAPDSTTEQVKIRTVEPSTPNKELRIDFGAVSPDNLRSFPRATTARVYVTKAAPNGESAGGAESVQAQATILWNLRPVTFMKFREEFQLYNDGAPEDISQLMHDIAAAHSTYIKTGAQLTTQAMNTMYGDPAKDLIYGPFIIAGFHGAGSLLKTGRNFGRTVATGIRDAKGGEAVVRYTTTIERGESIGTVTQSAARADAIVTSGATGECITDTTNASLDAKNAVDEADAAINKAKTLKISLEQEGKATEAAQVQKKIDEMEELRDEAREALLISNTKRTEASTQNQAFGQKIQDIENGDPQANFYEELEEISDYAAAAATSNQTANQNQLIASYNSKAISNLSQEVSSIAHIAGFEDNATELNSAATATRNLSDTAISSSKNAYYKSENLFERNARKLRKTDIIGAGEGCFAEGTPVAMADGSFKPIEKLNVGDIVLSKNPLTKALSTKEVTRKTVHDNIPTIKLHISDGSLVETTANHPFFIQSEHGFESQVVPAGQLCIGNSIVTRAGPPLGIIGIESTGKRKTVYNFTVADFHTYFVGTSQLWVHNVDCSDYLQGLQTRPALYGTQSDRDYQGLMCGDKEFLLTGENAEVWADGVIVKQNGDIIALDAKNIRTPSRSPFIPGSDCPSFVRDSVVNKLNSELQRYAAIINDPNVPVKSLEIITNNFQAADFFRDRMQHYNIPGRVVVRI